MLPSKLPIKHRKFVYFDIWKNIEFENCLRYNEIRIICSNFLEKSGSDQKGVNGRNNMVSEVPYS